MTLEQILSRAVPPTSAGYARLPNNEIVIYQNYQDKGQIVAILDLNGNIRTEGLKFPPGGRDNPNPPPLPGANPS
jgi:hypothetical protein